MLFSKEELSRINEQLCSQSPKEIVEWAVAQNRKTVVTTNFGPHEAAILHLVSEVQVDMPVICIDHGYNTVETYQVAEELPRRLGLNMQMYTPRISRRYREVNLGGVPSIDELDRHAQFTEEVKLEPFRRAFSEFRPEIWLTSIRKDQTAHRASLDIVTYDSNMQCIKVAPFFNSTELDMEEYLVNNDLPIVEDYYDPTKVLGHRECGLHRS